MNAEDKIPSKLIDLSDFRLDDILKDESSVLRDSIAAILAEAERSAASISGWSSYIEKENEGEGKEV